MSRAYFDGIARTSQEGLDPEVTISEMAESWDPEIEWDTSGGPVLEIAVADRFRCVGVPGPGAVAVEPRVARIFRALWGGSVPPDENPPPGSTRSTLCSG